jgi:hypothetical protein
MSQRYCFYLDETEPDPTDRNRFRVSVVRENEPGHYPTGGGDKAPWYWDKATCREQNAKLGLTEDDEFKIVVSSMFPKSHSPQAQ